MKIPIKLESYKLAHVDKDKIKAAARKAMMAADNLYYAWEAEHQEKYRVSMPDEAGLRIQQVLLESILGIKCKLEEVDDVWDELPLDKVNSLNWAKLLTSGVGDDFIFLNELMAENASVLDFPTLYDYNYDDHLFQEKANKKENPDYKGMDYYALRHPFWFRLIIQELFYYATGTSLASYISDELEEFSRDFINQLIPHEFTKGKDNGKKEGGGFLWDLKLDANGLEGQLDELNHSLHAYLNDRWLMLSKDFANSSPVVYVEQNNWDNDPHLFFIFANEQTLKQLRWKHFLSDIEPLIADFSDVIQKVEQETELLKSFLIQKHQAIMANYDPKVVKLKKKKKIIMAPDVFKQFE